MAINQVINRSQNHVHDVIPTQAMRDAEVAARIANRADSSLIQERKSATGRINMPTAFISPFAGNLPVAPATEDE